MIVVIIDVDFIRKLSFDELMAFKKENNLRTLTSSDARVVNNFYYEKIHGKCYYISEGISSKQLLKLKLQSGARIYE